jgi:hypothetical protein
MVSKRLALIPVLVALVALGFAGMANAQSAVSMSAVEFAFEPSTLNVTSSTVMFTLRNDAASHTTSQSKAWTRPCSPAI